MEYFIDYNLKFFNGQIYWSENYWRWNLWLSSESNQQDQRYVSTKVSLPFIAGEIVAIKRMKKKYYRWDQCINQKEI